MSSAVAFWSCGLNQPLDTHVKTRAKRPPPAEKACPADPASRASQIRNHGRNELRRGIGGSPVFRTCCMISGSGRCLWNGAIGSMQLLRTPCARPPEPKPGLSPESPPWPRRSCSLSPGRTHRHSNLSGRFSHIPFAHDRPCRLGHEERASEMDIEDRVPACPRSSHRRRSAATPLRCVSPRPPSRNA